VTSTAVSGVGEATASPEDSLETLIFRSASAALDDAGIGRDQLDGVVISASDQVDGRAISSMLTSGPAGAYLNEEINVASSPGHALALAYLQILSGTHRRLLLSSWGKASETAGGSTQPAERLSNEPFFARDCGLTALAAAALQAQAQRGSATDPEVIDEAAARVAARNHGDRSADEVAASPVVAHPLRALEWPPELDGSYSLVIERAEGAPDRRVLLLGAGWCSDSGAMASRDLAGLPHLARAADDAFRRAGLGRAQMDLWELHDYTPHAEMLAYGAVGLCPPEEVLDVVPHTTSGAPGAFRVNPSGGSLRGEAPFGGALRKVIAAVRQLRGEAGSSQVRGAQRAFVQISSGFAGQFQSAFVLQAA
jgi:acetyl-CoA C-acetyltransferase